MHLADAFIQSDLQCIQVTVFTILSALAFPGNRTHDLGVASAMLYHLSYRKALGTEDTKWWSVSGVILSHSSCKQVLRWATVRGLRCRILRFKMRHTFSIGDRSGLQAGQSSTRTLFLCSQDFVMCAECGFALSCWNMHGRPWKRCLLEGSILCSKISMYFSALMVPSQKCKLPLPRALTQPHTMTDPGFWTCCW